MTDHVERGPTDRIYPADEAARLIRQHCPRRAVTLPCWLDWLAWLFYRIGGGK